MVINSDFEGTFTIPYGFDTDRLHLGLFWATNQILRIFTNNRPLPCEMKAFCTQSQVEGYDINVDERCDKNPWSRCGDDKLCPFGAIWKHWSLSKYEPDLKK